MRVLSLTSLVSFLSFNLVSASIHNRLDARALIPPADVCANINLNIYTALGLVDLLGKGKLAVCLCASTVGPYVQANILLQSVANLLGGTAGENAVVNVLLNAINTQGQHCTYPLHSMPFCMTGNPCDFGCNDGYTKSGNTCVCPAPKIECNGQCQTQACSSSVPQGPIKRSESSPDLRSRMRILTDERCSRGQRLCGGGGTRRRGVEDWECIDTRATLDSCGGCMYHYALDDRPVEGSDCTAISGVSGVECRAGRCMVHRCKRGWTVGPSASECIPEPLQNNAA